MKISPITANGYRALVEKLDNLKNVHRPAISKELAQARTITGDLAHNLAYQEARSQQSFIEDLIAELELKISRSIEVTPKDTSKVTFGVAVTVTDEDTQRTHTYRLVGPYEADLSKGTISTTSPLGEALMGKSVSDEVSYDAPGGPKCFVIESITL